jgi:transcriptional regulator with XRE-family HTH domain
VKSALNRVDVYVGARLRMRRAMMGMSQGRLGEILGVTFQQIQKYEKGVNRISASRLKQAASVFDVDVNWFYEGSPAEQGPKAGLAEGPSRAFDVGFLSTTEGFRLNRAFTRIRDSKVRRKIIDLVESLAPPDDWAETETGASAGAADGEPYDDVR